jgi:hypothetical protein
VSKVSRNGRKAQGSPRRSLLLAGGALLLGATIVPTVSSAFSSGFDSRPVSLDARGAIGSFTPASVDPRLAASVKVGALAKGHLFRFTPAGSANRPDRAVTVAVRIDRDDARLASVRTGVGGASGQSGAGSFRIAPVAYSLGVSRGYQNFAAGKAVVASGLQRIDMPDLSSFSPAKGGKASAPGRFAPRIALDEKDRTGRAPRTLEGQGETRVDLGGSYRVTGNLKVIGGVRYTTDRDRLAPLTDGQQDSQAVYVGTQFRF